ncbi:MAG: TatD family hydrolase [Defluviitaleaceae bacterium]|nr:TatD family hydrolase [Defluviitaleaceae bacterium]
MKYFDAHAHYLDRKFNRDRHELMLDMHKNGVEYIINSTNSKDLERGLQLAKRYDFVYLSILDDGYYKENADIDKEEARIDELLEKSVARFKKLCAQNKKIVAMGEFGMDFRRTRPTPEEVRKQSFWFKKDLEASRQLGLPVVIHSGDACNYVFNLLQEADMPDYGHGKGMIHCYLGSPEMAMDYIKMGYIISVTGLVTHRSPRGKNLVEVVKRVPLESMVIETDCPYLTPVPFRDKRNDSGLLRLTVEEIAKLKKTSAKEVARITTANAKALFRII